MVAALLVPASASATPSTARIIVQHEPGVSGDEQKEIRAEVDGTLVDTLKLPRTEVIAVDRNDLKSALRSLNRDPGVAIAEEDRVVHGFAPDPDFGELWGLESTGQPVGPSGSYTALPTADINAPEAWSMSLGAGRTVAAVDSGVLATHADLAGRVAAGYDWVDEDRVPNDLDGHGTHVTGTIAANLNNGTGVAGVAPASRVLPLRVLDADGNGFLSDIIDAFEFAGDQGVRVVNASLGGSTASALEKQAIDEHPDTLYVVAAGNGGSDFVGDNVGTSPVYPCSFSSPNVLCVGAYHARNGRTSFSNYGTPVDVYAPGQDIYSTSKTGDYEFMSGTSMAAPHVAGIAALLLARNPSLSTADVRTAITSTARVRPTAFTPVLGVDAEAAVGSVPADRDGDAVEDEEDNCPDVPNTDQTDSTPGDETGDACEDGAPPVNADEDGVLVNDACPQEPGAVSAQGCPGVASDSNRDGVPDMFDGDGDSVPNARDNCPTRSNRDQADADRDRIGNACDSTPRGPDADGDGRPLLDDRCPTVYARTASGCPVTPPPVIKDTDADGRKDNVDACPYERALGTLNGCPLPAVTALSAKPRKRGGKRYASIAVRTSRGATVRLLVQRKVGKRWRKVTTTTLATSASNRVTFKTKRLKRGRYRVRVVVSSAAGSAATVTKAFRVR
jgi:subtilisin family serine protease